MRCRALLSAAATLSLTLAACAGGNREETKADLIDDLSQSLQGDGVGFDEDAADCYAEIVVDEVGIEALKDLDLSAEVPPEELQEQIAAAAPRGTEECDLPEPSG